MFYLSFIKEANLLIESLLIETRVVESVDRWFLGIGLVSKSRSLWGSLRCREFLGIDVFQSERGVLCLKIVLPFAKKCISS